MAKADTCRSGSIQVVNRISVSETPTRTNRRVLCSGVGSSTRKGPKSRNQHCDIEKLEVCRLEHSRRFVSGANMLKHSNKVKVTKVSL